VPRLFRTIPVKSTGLNLTAIVSFRPMLLPRAGASGNILLPLVFCRAWSKRGRPLGMVNAVLMQVTSSLARARGVMNGVLEHFRSEKGLEFVANRSSCVPQTQPTAQKAKRSKRAIYWASYSQIETDRFCHRQQNRDSHPRCSLQQQSQCHHRYGRRSQSRAWPNPLGG